MPLPPKDFKMISADHYDTIQPRLGLYDAVSVDMMDGRPYDWAWAQIFRRFDAETLFKLSLRSCSMFKIVMEYVKECTPATHHVDERRAGGQGDRLSGLSLDLFPLIIDNLKLPDRTNLSRVSRKFRALCATELQANVRRLLLRFGLCHAQIRFMQTATGAIISGLATGYLLDHDVIPTRLDFYTSDFTYTSVLRFFDLASVYDGWAQNCVRDHDGVAHVTTYFDPSSDDFIQISKSHTDSPMDLVPHAPFSHLFAAVTHYGMWLGYPDTTMARISYPNRDMIRFGDPRSFYHMTSVIGDYIEDYRFRFSLDRGHLCGSSFECPVTPRHTADEGCLNLFFPCAPFAAPSDATSVYPTRSAMSWSLDARGCPRGRPEMPGRLEIRQREDGYTYWKREMEEVIMKAAWRRIFRRLILIT